VTIESARKKRLFGTGAIGRRIRSLVALFARRKGLEGASRAEFEQTARDLDLSHPELYRLLTGQVLSDAAVERRLKGLEIAPQRIAARPEQAPLGTQAILPIGPSCC
jgi:hypothetical protein